MAQSPLIGRLIEAFQCLPGVGPKSAQRMTYYLLERNRQGANLLADTLHEAVQNIGNCQRCRTLSEHPLCPTCSNPARDASLLCVVETPSDMQLIELATGFKGRYFVLMGHLSPLDGIGPEEIGMSDLEKIFAEGQVREVILATNPTVEGEATAHYISDMAHQYAVRATRLAHGVPLGGELEFVDGGTLSHAFSSRKDL